MLDLGFGWSAFLVALLLSAVRWICVCHLLRSGIRLAALILKIGLEMSIVLALLLSVSWLQVSFLFYSEG